MGARLALRQLAHLRCILRRLLCSLARLGLPGSRGLGLHSSFPAETISEKDTAGMMSHCLIEHISY